MQKLICISLITNHVKHLFIKPFALMNIWCIISLVKCLLRHLSIFSISLIHFKVILSYFSLLLACCHSLFQLCSLYLITMPLKIGEIKDFLLTVRQKDAKSVKINKNKDNVKFKVGCSIYLYTYLFIIDKKKVQKERTCLQVWQWRNWSKPHTLIWTVLKFLKFLKEIRLLSY